MKQIIFTLMALSLTPILRADCPHAATLIGQAFALAVRERVPLLESAAAECPSFGTWEALGESHQARAEWDSAEKSYALAGSHLNLTSEQERQHQRALLLYRSAQIAFGRHQLCRAVAQYAEAARQFSGAEQSEVRADMLVAESAWTQADVGAADIQCALKTQLRAQKDYCDGDQCRLYHDASVDVPVQFATDSAELSAAAQKQVKDIADGAGPFTHEGYQLRVTGHTDQRGTREHNYLLSRARAHTVAAALAATLNVPLADIQTDGKGFDEPKYQGDSPEVERLNRRVEVALKPAANPIAGGRQ